MEARSLFCEGHSDKASKGCANCVARSISLCSHVDEVGMRRLRSISRQQRFSKGTEIFGQGGTVDRVFVVTEGMIKLFQLLPDGARQVTGFLGPGDILGSIKRQGRSHCTAEAITDVSACSFDKAAFEKLLLAYPGLCFSLLATATDEIEAQHEQIALLGRKRANQRLAAFLLTFAQRWHPWDGEQPIVSLPMARSDIADYLGLRIESVSRTLRSLKLLGLIEIPKPDSEVLKNVPALYVLAGFDEMPEARVAIGL